MVTMWMRVLKGRRVEEDVNPQCSNTMRVFEKLPHFLVVGQFYIYIYSYICEYGNYKYRNNQSNKTRSYNCGSKKMQMESLELRLRILSMILDTIEIKLFPRVSYIRKMSPCCPSIFLRTQFKVSPSCQELVKYKHLCWQWFLFLQKEFHSGERDQNALQKW